MTQAHVNQVANHDSCFANQCLCCGTRKTHREIIHPAWSQIATWLMAFTRGRARKQSTSRSLWNKIKNVMSSELIFNLLQDFGPQIPKTGICKAVPWPTADRRAANVALSGHGKPHITVQRSQVVCVHDAVDQHVQWHRGCVGGHKAQP